MLAILDADVIAYRLALDTEAWNMPLYELEHVVHQGILDWISDIPMEDKPEDKVPNYLLCISGSSFRYAVYPEYKAARKGKEQPRYRQDILHVMKEGFRSAISPILEGDDMLGIVQTSMFGESVIVSIDKDLDQIPGWHYNPDKESLYHIDETEADFNFHLQWLMGDSSDSYPGIPRVGDKKARKILEPYDRGEWTAACLCAYYEHGLDFSYAVQQGRLAKILTADMWNSADKTIKMWEPKQWEGIPKEWYVA